LINLKKINNKKLNDIKELSAHEFKKIKENQNIAVYNIIAEVIDENQFKEFFIFSDNGNIAYDYDEFDKYLESNQ
jgi:hypothetical protein